MFRESYRYVNKYKNKSCFYNGSHYDSMAEANYAADLDLRVKAGDIKSWERQIPFPVYHEGMKITTPVIDFLVHNNDGSSEYVEVKSAMTASLADYRIKRKLIEAELKKTGEATYRVEIYRQLFKRWR